jgi:C-terminal processing protease CtpA/Prc
MHTQITVVGKAETSFLPGVKIPSLADTSLAARSGLKSGDVILRVGDAQISSDPGQVWCRHAEGQDVQEGKKQASGEIIVCVLFILSLLLSSLTLVVVNSLILVLSRT